MAVTVRVAQSPDAEIVATVARAAWRATYEGLLGRETVEKFLDDAYALRVLRRRIAEHYFLVAEDDRQVIAFADAIEQSDHVRLAAIYALPDRRRTGAGRLLLAEIRSQFPKVPIAADVLVDNRQAERFYEHMGFQPGDLLRVELFGKPILERRWWLQASSEAASVPPPRFSP